jgi:site-specific recombinase XerD
MNDFLQIQDKNAPTGADAVVILAKRIAAQAPSLADLTSKQLEAVANAVVAQNLTAELSSAVKTACIDYQKERETFLQSIGKTGSAHTYRSFNNALKKLERFTADRGINLLELTYAQADDFIYALRAGDSSLVFKQGAGISASTVHYAVKVAGAFFNFLIRRHQDAIKINPFRGTKARPPKKPARAFAIPTPREIKAIIKALPPLQAAEVSVMSGRGLRAGALPSLLIDKDRLAFKAHSKGKDISGTISMDILTAIKTAGLDSAKPFYGLNANAIERNIIYHTNKLYKAGKINAPYSCHDFRHAFAVNFYRKTKDIYALRNLLSHASIAITETYLKGLGELA